MIIGATLVAIGLITVAIDILKGSILQILMK